MCFRSSKAHHTKRENWSQQRAHKQHSTHEKRLAWCSGRCFQRCENWSLQLVHVISCSRCRKKAFTNIWYLNLANTSYNKAFINACSGKEHAFKTCGSKPWSTNAQTDTHTRTNSVHTPTTYTNKVHKFTTSIRTCTHFAIKLWIAHELHEVCIQMQNHGREHEQVKMQMWCTSSVWTSMHVQLHNHLQSTYIFVQHANTMHWC